MSWRNNGWAAVKVFYGVGMVGNMRQWWVASALLEIEPTLWKVNGYQRLKEPRDVMKSGLVKENARVKAA